MSDDKTKQLHQELELIKKQAQEYLDGWKRAKADYLNREREIEKEKIEWIKFANLELILNLLPVLDAFEQSIKQLPEEMKDNDWVKGILKIKEQLGAFLKAQGVEKIKTVDEKFNPEYHEATDKQGDKGEIAKEVQSGYTMHGQVIRPAKVIIN